MSDKLSLSADMTDLSRDYILIDSNIYLECYKGTYNNYRDLLKNLKNLRPSIVFTSTIRDEILRNKLSVYLATKYTELDSLALGPLIPAHHLPSSGIEEHDEIKEARTKLSDAIKEYKNNVKRFHSSNAKAILEGTDYVSVALRDLMTSASEASDEQRARARLRREIGNPPGKRSDPLGDQLNWEQFLDRIESSGRIWIVTKDRDYMSYVGKDIFLNPLLKNDIERVAPGATLNCFENLADFIGAIRNTNLSGAVISNDGEIEEAKKEYSANTAVEAVGSTISLAGSEPRIRFLRGNPVACGFSDDGKHEFDMRGFPMRSAYGGSTLWVRCTKCGFQFDTGDSIDD